MNNRLLQRTSTHTTYILFKTLVKFQLFSMFWNTYKRIDSYKYDQRSLVSLWETINMWMNVLYINMYFWFSSSKSKIQSNLFTLLRLCHLILFLNENDCFYKLCQWFSYTRPKIPQVFFHAEECLAYYKKLHNIVPRNDKTVTITLSVILWRLRITIFINNTV